MIKIIQLIRNVFW